MVDNNNNNEATLKTTKVRRCTKTNSSKTSNNKHSWQKKRKRFWKTIKIKNEIKKIMKNNFANINFAFLNCRSAFEAAWRGMEWLRCAFISCSWAVGCLCLCPGRVRHAGVCLALHCFCYFLVFLFVLPRELLSHILWTYVTNKFLSKQINKYYSKWAFAQSVLQNDCRKMWQTSYRTH